MNEMNLFKSTRTNNTNLSFGFELGNAAGIIAGICDSWFWDDQLIFFVVYFNVSFERLDCADFYTIFWPIQTNRQHIFIVLTEIAFDFWCWGKQNLPD